jgi:cytochrome c-type biogenesis protein CcmI
VTLWLLLGVLALVALAPLALAVLRPARARGRAEADLALYRGQLTELDRERDAGRLDPAQHQAATLEVQRRILAAPRDEAPEQGGARTGAILAALVFILPAAAIGLFFGDFFGRESAQMLLAALPALVLGSWLGVRAYKVIPAEGFRLVLLSFLLLSGLSLII